MKVLDITESPGSPAKPTEDRAGSSGNLAWVIDGATDFSNESTLPGSSNVQWLVRLVDQSLHDLGAVNKYTRVIEVFDRLGETVRAELASLAPDDLRNHPCCSIGLAAFDADSVEVGRIGDATLVTYQEERVTREVSTDFFDAREAQAVERSRTSLQTRPAIMAGISARRAEYIKGVHGESVFSGHPEAVFKVHRATVPLTEADTVLICTDGFARAIADYRIFTDWQGLGRRARDEGLDRITSLIRQYEATSAGVSSGNKFKSADDVAAILLGNEGRR
ncbi:protein phosphatase 2C domain-containing protein [Sphaerisporangium sp. NPDC088356]|uniref:protein phosphatase 2C domain-containing protein n=1 Tax=Sphaerisporangium sp. NPDC088356 TaxID=3154871 RepID=UPI00343A47F2